MTIKEFKTRLNEVLQASEIETNLKKECLRLAKSGGVNLEVEYNYAIIKTILRVALLNEAQKTYIAGRYNKIADNLLYF